MMEIQQKKILIVDDEAEVVELMGRLLARQGYEVLSALNGKQALKILMETCPDLIILDFLMPEMDGFSFYKELKKNKEVSKTPVMILTARANMEDSFLALGADDFLPKPFEGEDLIKRIRAILEKEQDPKATGRVRILIAGNSLEVNQKMADQLETKTCLADHALTSADLLTKALQLQPETILLDVRMKDAPAHEIVRSLRSLSAFRDRFIFLYTFLIGGEENCGIDQEEYNMIQDEKDACLKEGANEYLGEITEDTFQDAIVNYLNKQMS